MLQVRAIWKGSGAQGMSDPACRPFSLCRQFPARRDWAASKQPIREIYQTRIRYRYHRVHVLPVREGWPIIIERTPRLCNAAGKRPQRRVTRLREATRCKQTRPMGFVHDQPVSGKKMRVLSSVDVCSRFLQALDSRLGNRGEDVVAKS